VLGGLLVVGLPNLWFDVALGSFSVAVDALVEPLAFVVLADAVFVFGFAFAVGFFAVAVFFAVGFFVIFAMIISPCLF
jgi:hypothetical protein